VLFAKHLSFAAVVAIVLVRRGLAWASEGWASTNKSLAQTNKSGDGLRDISLTLI
jgi:hypothetical protein